MKGCLLQAAFFFKGDACYFSVTLLFPESFNVKVSH